MASFRRVSAAAAKTFQKPLFYQSSIVALKKKLLSYFKMMIAMSYEWDQYPVNGASSLHCKVCLL